MRKFFYGFITLLSFLFVNITNGYTTDPPNTPPIGTTTLPHPSSMFPPNPAAIDANITVDVQNSIARNDSLSGLGITVTTIDGVVTLNGTVYNQSQADLAITLAQSVTGVKDVQSKIVVKPELD